MPYNIWFEAGTIILSEHDDKYVWDVVRAGPSLTFHAKSLLQTFVMTITASLLDNSTLTASFRPSVIQALRRRPESEGPPTNALKVGFSHNLQGLTSAWLLCRSIQYRLRRAEITWWDVLCDMNPGTSGRPKMSFLEIVCSMSEPYSNGSIVNQTDCIQFHFWYLFHHTHGANCRLTNLEAYVRQCSHLTPTDHFTYSFRLTNS